MRLTVTGLGLLYEIPLRAPLRRNARVFRVTHPCHERAVLQRQFFLQPPQSKQPLLMEFLDLVQRHLESVAEFWVVCAAAFRLRAFRPSPVDGTVAGLSRCGSKQTSGAVGLTHL